jgi:two-component system, OmpR family, sensor kinase
VTPPWHRHRHHHHGPDCGPGGRWNLPWWRMQHGLRRRLFVWFGVTIAVTGAFIGTFLHATDGRARIGAPIMVGIALWLASGFIAWRLTRPLMQVIRVTRDIRDGKLESRIELGRHAGELGILAASVNDMAARIEKQIADQRELLAAVSHEIRTPLGHLRILFESAREKNVDPALVADCEREVLEIDRLVGQLLAGSRLDFGTIDKRSLDGADLAALALERAGLDPERLDVSASDVSLAGDPTLLARALANLLDNAERHAGGAVRLGVRAGDSSVVFEVDDRGPGFAAEDLPRAFESFYRGRQRGHGSLGLGLSLVRRIAVAHGGRAWAENLPDGGARVSFSVAGADRGAELGVPAGLG